MTTLVGFAMGFRTSAPLGSLLLAVALCIFAAFAFTWMFVLLGIIAGNPQAAQGMGLLVFPFTFVSSAFVPVESMPGWMQSFAENQPLTQIVNATRAYSLGRRRRAGPGPRAPTTSPPAACCGASCSSWCSRRWPPADTSGADRAHRRTDTRGGTGGRGTVDQRRALGSVSL